MFKAIKQRLRNLPARRTRDLNGLAGIMLVLLTTVGVAGFTEAKHQLRVQETAAAVAASETYAHGAHCPKPSQRQS